MSCQEWPRGNRRLLLGRADVLNTTYAEYGQAPRYEAAENGHYRIVELLEARHPIYPMVGPPLIPWSLLPCPIEIVVFWYW